MPPHFFIVLCCLMTAGLAVSGQGWCAAASAPCSTTLWSTMALDLQTCAKPVLRSPSGIMGPWPAVSWGAHALAWAQVSGEGRSWENGSGCHPGHCFALSRVLVPAELGAR